MKKLKCLENISLERLKNCQKEVWGFESRREIVFRDKDLVDGFSS